MFFFSSLRCVVCGMCFVHLLGYNNRELRKKKSHGFRQPTWCVYETRDFLYGCATFFPILRHRKKQKRIATTRGLEFKSNREKNKNKNKNKKKKNMQLWWWCFMFCVNCVNCVKKNHFHYS